MTKVNDFVVKFANVNGSGSASANLMFAKSIFRMGIPVTPKNIFPSNIQGLPTWFEVRISKDGYAARREGIDCFITLNPQTYQTDMKILLSFLALISISGKEKPTVPSILSPKRGFEVIIPVSVIPYLSRIK